ncbi:MAG: hypothetical protein ACLPVI_07530 [Dehalococcoidales bacterium]
MKKYSLQEWLGKLALTGVLIGLFTVAAFTPEINSLGTGITTSDGIISALNSQRVQPVFTSNVEYVNLTEPVNGNTYKAPSFSTNVIPVIYLSSAFHTNNQYPGKYISLSGKIPAKSFQQMCLLADIPPPVLC